MHLRPPLAANLPHIMKCHMAGLMEEYLLLLAECPEPSRPLCRREVTFTEHHAKAGLLITPVWTAPSWPFQAVPLHVKMQKE